MIERTDVGAAGTEFYRQNRAAMDAGEDVSWRERSHYDEFSAIQHAMNLKLQDESIFFAGYQIEPLPEEIGGADQLTADQVAEKINNLLRRTMKPKGRTSAITGLLWLMLYWKTHGG